MTSSLYAYDYHLTVTKNKLYQHVKTYKSLGMNGFRRVMED